MKQRHLVATVLAMIGIAANGEPLAVGAAAPNVTGITHAGEKLDFGTLWTKGLVLVYFFPKADTPGCTAQGCSLRDAYADLTAKGLTVIGVSTDSVEAQKAFREKYHLPFTLVADPDKTVINAFGVPAAMGFAARQTFLVRDGKIVWRDLKARPREQAADVLAVLAAGPGAVQPR